MITTYHKEYSDCLGRDMEFYPRNRIYQRSSL